MEYNIDGEEIEIDFKNNIFHDGYNDGMDFQAVREEFNDLGKVHDKYSKNSYEKDSYNYKVYKAGFIQCIS